MHRNCKARRADRKTNRTASANAAAFNAGCHRASRKVLCAGGGWHGPTEGTPQLVLPMNDTPQFQPLEPRLLLSGTQYVVDSLLDTVADDGAVTLREAIEAANTNAAVFDAPAGSADEADSITFAPELAGQTITLNGTQLEITDSLNLTGPAEKITLDADGMSRVIHIASPDENAPITANLESLAITGGYVDETSPSEDRGAGLYIEQAEVNISHSTIASNIADTSSDSQGGGIYTKDSTLQITHSNITYNTASSGGGMYINKSQIAFVYSDISFNINDGISNYSSALTFINSTVSGNSTIGIYSGYKTGLTITLTNSTITANGVGGIVSFYSSATINNSIIALNGGGNIPSHAFTGQNNIIGMDPLFVENPSPGPDEIWGTADDITGDLRLSSASIAINTGDNNLAVDESGQPLETDIADQTRVADGIVDAGAYEYQQPLPVNRETPSTVVTSLEDTVDTLDQKITLREALLYSTFADTGSRITFASDLAQGVINLAEDQLYINRSVSIDASFVGGITLSAAENNRVALIYGDSPQIEFNSLSIVNGSSWFGGGIHIDSATLAMQNCTITNNSSPHAPPGFGVGGGIYSKESSVTLDNCSLTNNYASEHGGGYFGSYGSSLIVSNSYISSNSADNNGGGIYYYIGSGVYADSTPATVSKSLISRNTALSGGGVYGYNINIHSSIITDNTAVYGAGGSIGNATIVNTIISNNSAESQGGGLSIGDDSTITNSTITCNYAADSGGGIYARGRGYPEVTLHNTIVALNHAEYDPQLFIHPSTATISNNNSLIDTDPLFIRNPSPGPDGQWATDDDDYGDLRLQPYSYAINRGNNELAVDAQGQPLNVDFDGNTRIIDGQVDIGAYEYQEIWTSPEGLPSHIVTTLEDVIDSNDNRISLREAIITNHSAHETIIFSPELVDGTITLNGSPLTIIDSVDIDASLAGNITIDAAGQSRVIHLYGKNTTVNLSNLTLTNGHATVFDVGGGIYIQNSSLYMTNCNLENNYSGMYGGAIYNQKGTLSLSNCQLAGNNSERSGGAIYNETGDITVTHTTFTKNVAKNGTSIYSKGDFDERTYSYVYMDSCYVYGNGFMGDYVTPSTSITIYGSVFTQMEIINSVIVGNATASIYSDLLTLIGCTIAANNGQLPTSNDSIYNTIVALNETDGESNLKYDNNDLYYSLIDTDPLFIRNPSPGPDGIWGTDDDDYGDLRLRPDSPAIDAGFYDETIPLTDFLGRSRHDDPNVTNTGSGTPDYIDIGAYEAQYPLPALNADFNGDGSVSLADLDILSQNFGLGANATKGQGDANHDGRVSLIDLDILGRTFGAGPMRLGENAFAGPLTLSAAAPVFHTLDDLFDGETREQWELV